jgi:hypothetical protein
MGMATFSPSSVSHEIVVMWRRRIKWPREGFAHKLQFFFVPLYLHETGLRELGEERVPQFQNAARVEETLAPVS